MDKIDWKTSILVGVLWAISVFIMASAIKLWQLL